MIQTYKLSFKHWVMYGERGVEQIGGDVLDWNLSLNMRVIPSRDIDSYNQLQLYTLLI